MLAWTAHGESLLAVTTALHCIFCGVQSWLNVDFSMDPTLRTSELNSICKMPISNVEVRAQRLSNVVVVSFACCCVEEI